MNNPGYIVTPFENRIRKVDPSGIITTVFGGAIPLGDGGPATQASVHHPRGVYGDSMGDLYIADTHNFRVRKMDTSGTMMTILDDNIFPTGVFVDARGNVSIAPPYEHRVRKVAQNGTVTIIAGNGSSGFSGDGGPATQASLNTPFGVFGDGVGTLYIADSDNQRIRKVDASGVITAVAGHGVAGFSGDSGPATQANLNHPVSGCVDRAGNLYIADSGNGRIRKIDSHGMITTIAGTGISGFTGDGGPATEASLNGAAAVFVDGVGNLYIADNNNNRVHKVLSIAAPTPFPQAMTDSLQVTEAFAKPGGQAVVDIVLHTEHPVAGLQFNVQPQRNGAPTTAAHFSGLINDLDNAGFTATSATDAHGVTTVLLFSPSGAQILPGIHPVLQLVYAIDPAIPPGTVIDLVASDDILSDPNSQPILHHLRQGAIHIGQPGDVAGGLLGAGDGQIDILDVIKEIQYILGRLPLPSPTSFAHFVADLNGDGSLDILDIVGMINAILDHTGQPKVVAGPTGPVAVSLGAIQRGQAASLTIPVMMQTDGLIAGAQATFTFDGTQLQVGTPQLVGRADGMTLQRQLTDGTLRLVVYSATGQGIPAGSGTTLLIPVTLLGGPVATPTFTLSQVVLANHQAQLVPVVLGSSTVKVQALPHAFALQLNHPNPFNPSTQIAYEVPQAAHVTLAVYNILGQEVVRLVEAQQAPGRYVVTWTGRNTQGVGVASGVYLYRLTTSTGFSQTRRMTLVK